MDIRFDNKVAFVTGAAGDIGFAAAKMFAEAGAKVAMADMNEKRINEAADSLNRTGYDVLPITFDVSDEQQVKMAVEQVVSHFGKIDVAYNNVGIHAAVRENLADTEGWDFDHVLAVNLRGIWNCMSTNLPR